MYTHPMMKCSFLSLSTVFSSCHRTQSEAKTSHDFNDADTTLGNCITRLLPGPLLKS